MDKKFVLSVVISGMKAFSVNRQLIKIMQRQLKNISSKSVQNANLLYKSNLDVTKCLVLSATASFVGFAIEELQNYTMNLGIYLVVQESILEKNSQNHIQL